MVDDLQAVLKDMDKCIAGFGAGSVRALAEEDVVKWRAALATALDRLDGLERASLSAVDAFLMRPLPSATPLSPSARSIARAGQKHMTRLATAMATLEQVLSGVRSGKDSSLRPDPPTGSSS